MIIKINQNLTFIFDIILIIVLSFLIVCTFINQFIRNLAYSIYFVYFDSCHSFFLIKNSNQNLNFIFVIIFVIIFYFI